MARWRAPPSAAPPMSFASLQYALFLPAVLVAHWAVPRRWRTGVLLVASYAFYGSWAWRFCVLLALITTVDWAVARAMATRHEHRDRRRLLAVSVAVNLGVLAYFKYAGFFVDEVSAGLAELGWLDSPTTVRILLPIGVSFFTFQSLGYVVDVFRRRLDPVRSWVDYALFVAFFPQLVAGPISRAESLMPQLRADRRPPTAGATTSALLLILRGLVKKVVIADALAPLVTPAFGGDADPGTLTALVGIAAFTGQIYADFSAYTDLARGSSRLFSIELVHNFRQPYLSRSITEFWRRWHITLSTWLRDYLYIPLGGNRGSGARTRWNLFVTMVLGGLWHGANWTFLVWGALHGAYLAVERALRVRVPDGEGLPTVRQLPRVALTLALVALAWVFFRADSIGQALDVLGALGDLGGTTPATGDVVLAVGLLGALATLDVVERVVRHPLDALRHRPLVSGAAVGVAVTGIVLFSGGDATPFIYFQF